MNKEIRSYYVGFGLGGLTDSVIVYGKTAKEALETKVKQPIKRVNYGDCSINPDFILEPCIVENNVPILLRNKHRMCFVYDN